MQIRWALIDPGHDKRATERVIQGIEASIKAMREEKQSLRDWMVTQKALVSAANMASTAWKEQYEQLHKSYMKVWNKQQNQQDMEYALGLKHAERMTSW